MNWFDIILIILLLVGGLEGFRRGFFREILKVGGFIIVLYLSFIFMNPLGNLLFKYLPLFSLHIIGIEIAALNILLYEIISFLLISTSPKLISDPCSASLEYNLNTSTLDLSSEFSSVLLICSY